MANNNDRGSNYCLSIRLVTVVAALLLQYAAIAEANWHIKFGMPPSPNNMQAPAVRTTEEDTPVPSARFDPNTLPMFMNPPYIIGSPRHFPVHKRMSDSALDSDAEGYADPSDTNVGMGKRSGTYRHFGRDSTSLRFGKRSFTRQSP